MFGLTRTPHGRVRSVPVPYYEGQPINAPQFNQYDQLADQYDENDFAQFTEVAFEDELTHYQNQGRYVPDRRGVPTIPQGYAANYPQPQPRTYHATMADYYDDRQAYDYDYYDEAHLPYPPQQGVQRRMLPLLLGVVLVAFLAIMSVGRYLRPLAADGGNILNLQANVAASTQSAEQPATAPSVAAVTGNTAGSTGRISPIFKQTVMHWEALIVQWADEHQLDPDALATIMQIESCGDPLAQSGAGATGLFQVMPFHFASGEDMFDPMTNAKRGSNYFAERMVQTSGNTYLSFAGYNGGHVAAGTTWSNWAAETQRYYTWGKGIYDDAKSGTNSSPALQEWLNAGGNSLCNQAAARLGYQ